MSSSGGRRIRRASAASEHHRTISTYANALISVGFAIEAVAEPSAFPLLAAQQPEYEDLPIFLGMRARRLRAA